MASWMAGAQFARMFGEPTGSAVAAVNGAIAAAAVPGGGGGAQPPPAPAGAPAIASSDSVARYREAAESGGRRLAWCRAFDPATGVG